MESELYELKSRLVNAERRLESLGYRHCDIPACNCNGYHYQHEITINQILRAALGYLRTDATRTEYLQACRVLGVKPDEAK